MVGTKLSHKQVSPDVAAKMRPSIADPKGIQHIKGKCTSVARIGTLLFLAPLKYQSCCVSYICIYYYICCLVSKLELYRPWMDPPFE
eukprot:c6635_g1_i1 orf=338-598(+)